MAKQPIKSEKKAATRNIKPKAPSIVKVAHSILDKLKALDIEHELRSEIIWCLGSYTHDNNPVGLYEVASKALATFKSEQAKKTKGITKKLIGDIEKALKAN